ncbi:hypothetical protein VPH35_104998 [Triticum aestivum]
MRRIRPTRPARHTGPPTPPEIPPAVQPQHLLVHRHRHVAREQRGRPDEERQEEKEHTRRSRHFLMDGGNGGLYGTEVAIDGQIWLASKMVHGAVVELGVLVTAWWRQARKD